MGWVSQKAWGRMVGVELDVCSCSATNPSCVAMVAMLASASAPARRRARARRAAVRNAVERHVEGAADKPLPAVARAGLSSNWHDRRCKIESSIESLIHQVCYRSYWPPPWLSTNDVALGRFRTPYVEQAAASYTQPQGGGVDMSGRLRLYILWKVGAQPVVLQGGSHVQVFL